MINSCPPTHSYPSFSLSFSSVRCLPSRLPTRHATRRAAPWAGARADVLEANKALGSATLADLQRKLSPAYAPASAPASASSASSSSSSSSAGAGFGSKEEEHAARYHLAVLLFAENRPLEACKECATLIRRAGRAWGDDKVGAVHGSPFFLGLAWFGLVVF